MTYGSASDQRGSQVEAALSASNRAAQLLREAAKSRDDATGQVSELEAALKKTQTKLQATEQR